MVLAVIVSIARNKTKSYRKVAMLARRPLVYHAVGNIMAKNRNPKIPCHRVIRSDGSPDGYARGSHAKAKILFSVRQNTPHHFLQSMILPRFVVIPSTMFL
jgi:O-6-methylguanine DNA methyltransferase